MIRAHKIRLNQANCLAHAAGTSCFVFNRGPGQWKRQYEAGATLSAPALKKQFDALRAQAYLWTLARLYSRTNSIRDDSVHKLTVEVARTCGSATDHDYKASLNLEQEACLLASPR
jgi:hypothetical protein